jgi:hypothetical protein
MFGLLRWICLLVALVAMIGLAFLLGLSFGLGNNHDKFITETVPVLSMLGGWVSGLGALLAVGFALLQSHKQHEKERARCRILLEQGEWFLKVQIVSDGIIPSTILAASILFDGKQKYELSSFPRLGFSFPKKLERGDVSALIDVNRDEYRRLALVLVELSIAELASRNVVLDRYNSQAAEQYFSELKLCGERDACLLLRTAHADLRHPLPPELMRTCFSLIEAEQREVWIRDRESLRNEFQQYRDLCRPTDGETPAD